MKTWFTCIVLYNGFQENAMDFTKKIGAVNLIEKVEYLVIDNERPLVRYKVDRTDRYKCVYVKWKGGCK